VLGPLLVADDAGGEIPVAAARHRALLAALLVRANRAVSVDELAEIVWDGGPPRTAARTLRSYMARLRHTLGPQVAVRIETREPGYLCRVAADELDLLRFEGLCRAGREALRAGEWSAAAEAASQALELWRGAPLLDVPSQLLRDGCVPRLEQLRVQALEDRAQAQLRLGQHERLVPELRELAGAHPLRERFHAQLVLALAAAGRRAEALDAYRQARLVLVEQLGVEPGLELRELHSRILAGQEVRPTEQAPEPAAEAVVGAVPRQLPAACGHFTGRRAELDVLTGLADAADLAACAGGTVVICAVDGMAGIGKTAFAVHAAHRLADRFPDGQLYVDLRGFDPSGAPLETAVAVRRFLDALAVPAARIPADPDAQVELYRSALAGKRMLIVLDNAHDSAQVRPLLPGSPGCLVLAAGRSRLADLIALHGAIPLTLDLLSRNEARELLTRRLGPQRVAREPQAVDDVIDLCARLPLALNIAAARAATHPSHQLSTLADDLRDTRRRLDTLATGEDLADVRAVFSWSYHHLPDTTACAFRLVGLHPGADWDTAAAAALTGTTHRQASRALAELARAHLIEQADPDRHTMHALLQAYARDLAEEKGERHAAFTRVLDHYLAAAQSATATLFPAWYTPPPGQDRPSPATGDVAAARIWLDAERGNLITMVQQVHRDWPHHTVQIACALLSYLEAGSHLTDAVTFYTCALQAARLLEDRRYLAATLTNLGIFDLRQGRYDQAHDHLTQALHLSRTHGDLDGEARALAELGVIARRHGDHATALHHQNRALALFAQIPDPARHAITLTRLAAIERDLGHLTPAAAHNQQALARFEELNDPLGQAHALTRLGAVERQLGQFTRSLDHHHRSLTIFRHHNEPIGEAEALTGLADTLHALGQLQPAETAYHTAIDLAKHIGDPYRETQARQGLTRIHTPGPLTPPQTSTANPTKPTQPTTATTDPADNNR
jgi:DNA-binding SARP family transcriptional activator/Tfp pilus assembly protein PilF